MSVLTAWMDRVLYPQYGDNWDDGCFRKEILALLNREWTILDLGAGAGIVPQMNFRGHAIRVHGLDPDPRVCSNPYLDEGTMGVGEKLPYGDATFDLVFADNLLEHLVNPAQVFNEIARTLKPGGYFLAKTPNRWHYVPTIARLTPQWFHVWVNCRRGRHRDDSFPTVYRANTPRDIRKHAIVAGLNMERAMFIEGRPEYLRGSAVTYVLGWLYERFVNLVPIMNRCRVLLIAVMRKPATPDAAREQLYAA